MQLIQRLGRWVRSLVRWMGEAWSLWVTVIPLIIIIPLIVASLLPLSPSESLQLCRADNVLRYCGLGYQLFGICTVVSGLRSKQRLFNLPGLFEKIRLWFARRPRWTQPPAIVKPSPVSVSAGVVGPKVPVWRGTPADGSIEDRIAALEANVTTLRKEQTEMGTEFQEARRKTYKLVDAERRERESAVTTLHVKLEGLGTGGLHIEMMGVFWLILGVVLATIPYEIAAGLASFADLF